MNMESKPILPEGQILETTSSSAQHAIAFATCKQEPDDPEDGMDLSKLDNIFICSMCDLTFETSDEIQSHMLTHAGEDSFQTLGAGNNIDIKIEPEAENDLTRKKYLCTLCNKIFCSKYNLNVHTRIHTGERPYTCSICGKTFGSSSNCKKHMKTHKSKGADEIKEDVDFMNYIKFQSGDRPYECITCAKSYTCKSDAQKHLRVHTGRKPFSCEFCGKTFSCSSNMYTHLRRKHEGLTPSIPQNVSSGSEKSSNACPEPRSKEVNEKMFKCYVCNLEFDTRSRWEGHMNGHNIQVSQSINKNVYNCTLCEETYSSFDDFLLHMLCHQKASSLTCFHCGKTFTRNMDYIYHQRIHTVEHILSCPSNSSQFDASMNDESSTDGESRAKPSCSNAGANPCGKAAGGDDGRPFLFSRMLKEEEENSLTLEKVPNIAVSSKDGQRTNVNDSAECKKILMAEADADTEEEDSSGETQAKYCSQSLSGERGGNDDDEGDDDDDTMVESETKGEKAPSVLVENIMRGTPAAKGSFKCVLCTESFSCHSDLNEHAKLHTGDTSCQCSLCKSGFCCSGNIKQDAINSFLEEAEDAGHECLMCSVVFESRKVYTDHMKVHSKEKSFICYFCGKTFSRMKNLRQHFVGHTGERAYNCSECGKSFIRKVNLKNHMRVHTGDQPYKCTMPMCHKAYNSKYDLITHIRSHTGEKPCHCPHCGKAFYSNGHLHKHMKTHIVGESQFKCIICYKTFFDSTTLRRHCMIHAGECPYKCDVCGKSFRRNIRLKYHMRIHTGEQPYKCSVCFKNYNSKYEMESHMRTHTGEKPYHCPMCDSSFQFKSSLNKHTKAHLEEDLLQDQVSDTVTEFE